MEKLSERMNRDDSISAAEYVEAVEALESENITLRLDCFNSEQRALKAESTNKYLSDLVKKQGSLVNEMEDKVAKAEAELKRLTVLNKSLRLIVK
jgi:hypothetical protein